jgi:cephalosporin-C deacetylase-like acetyl esterase
MKPTNFDSYWQTVLDELSMLPMAAELTELPIRSNEHGAVYGLKLTSIGPYRVFAYYCVPHAVNTNRPFPCVVHMPRYGSVNHIPPYEERQNYVSVQLCHRGQRLADSPYAAAYPGLLTDELDDPAHYIFRAIVADCVRMMDFVFTRAEINQSHISIVGNDLALLTAALRPNVDSVIAHPELFYNAAELAPATRGYPLEEINEFRRFYPHKAEAALRTLAYFDPLHFAPRIQATTLLVSGNEHDLFSPEQCAPLAAALGGPVEQRIATHSAFRDGVFEIEWLAKRHGVGAVVPNHWR